MVILMAFPSSLPQTDPLGPVDFIQYEYGGYFYGTITAMSYIV